MARRLRELVEDGIYHVVARGNGRSRIFEDDADCVEYLRLLSEVVRRFGWNVLAYCLMGNHVHLVVETPETNLPAGMQWLHGRYGRYFNDRHDRVGHLFQGRYRSIRQTTDEQLLQVLRYVALNPVEAGLCRAPRDYRWSSYGAALSGDARPLAIHRLSWLVSAREHGVSLDAYREMIEE